MNIDFNFWLFVLTLSAAVIGLVDRYVFQPKRLQPYQDSLSKLTKKARKQYIAERKALKPPLLADYARSLFIVLLVVFIIRGFFLGNFLIPSASMTPTLPVGDLVLVNKTAYNVRNPLTGNIWIKTGQPERGDIVVFHYPVNPHVDFIKRIVGLPGDHLSYNHGQLTINGKPLDYQNCKTNQYNAYNHPKDDNKLCTEIMPNDVQHLIFTTPSNNDPLVKQFVDVTVPPNMYFVMGDNRDNSEDSRYWGFVPRDNLVGKALVTWFSWDNQNHRVRWDQIGKTF